MEVLLHSVLNSALEGGQ